MEVRIARVISWIFHPIIMPLVGMFLIFNLNTYIGVLVQGEARETIYIVMAINTFLVPGFIVLYMRWKKMVSSLEMPHRHERWFPFIMTGFFFYFTYYLFRQVPLPQVIYSVMLGAVVMIALLTALNYRWKLSIHTAGLGGLTACVFAISEDLMVDTIPVIIVLFFLTGLVGYARLRLKSHRPMEVYAGATLGFLSMYSCLALELG